MNARFFLLLRQVAPHVVFPLFLVLLSNIAPFGQTSGIVFQGYNANGTKDINEPFVLGVTVNSYNAAGSLCGTATTLRNTAPNT